MQRNRIKILVESAMMIAIASVLSVIKIIDMPYGGSVTVASMLPIIIISYRHGIKNGIIAGIAYGAVQQLLGLKNLSYVSSWYSVITVIMLDYLAAFAVLGIGGLFRGKLKKQSIELIFGALLAGLLRFVCHFISGFTVWTGWSMPTGAAVLYSLGYNSTYMLPEVIILLMIAFYLGSGLDFTAEMPIRVNHVKDDRDVPYQIAGGAVLCAAVIADIVFIFSKLQNGETGEWYLDGLASVKWTSVIVITAVCIVAAIALFTYAKLLKKDKAQ